MTRKKRVNLVAIILLVFAFILTNITIFGSSIFDLNQSILSAEDLSSNAVANAVTNPDYGTLLKGSSYCYTDVAAIADFRAGNATTDMASHTVDVNQTHGSATNPFVISSVDQWNAFAADTTNAKDTSKVFVLGSDIDFSGQTFTPVTELKAKFYGNGFALKNITYTFGGSGNCGVFCTITQTQVTDLLLDNITFSKMGAYNGGICGTSNGGAILNCHFKGSTAPSNPGSNGGLVGAVSGTNETFIYRSSVKWGLTIKTTTDNSDGGILGTMIGNPNVYIWDCLTIVDLDVTNRDDYWYGGIHGQYNTSATGICDIQNVVSYTNAKLNRATSDTPSFGSILNGWQRSITETVKINNTYTSGKVMVGSSEYGMSPAQCWSGSNNCFSITPTNVHWYADKPIYQVGTSYDIFDSKNLNSNKYDGTVGKTQADMYAKSVMDLPSNVWVNKSVISEAYVTDTDITSSAGYSVYNAPMRNPVVIKVSYYNLTSTGENVLISDNNDTWFEVKRGETLKTPTTVHSGHTFLGWTPDTSGESEPIKNVVDGLIGATKLYAVWGVPNDQITKSIDITSPNNTATIKYGEGNVVLKANVKVPSNMTPDFSYKWFKDSGNDSILSGQSITRTTVADSGSYSVKYFARDKVEPLWFTSGSIDPVSVTINKGDTKLVPGSFKLDANSHPYVGAELSTLDFTAKFKDMQDKDVTGTAEWYLRNQEISDKNGMTNTVEILFTPDSENLREMRFTVSFEAEYIKMIFDMSYDIHDTMSIDMVYNQNYSASDIVSKFETEFTKKTQDPATQMQYNSVAHKTPYLNGVNINKFSTDYLNYKQTVTISVRFENQEYTVTFNHNDNATNPTITTAKYSYNQKIINQPTPTIPGSILLGWQYEVPDPTDPNKTVLKDWKFDTNYVYKDITLIANWTTAVLTLKSIDVKQNNPITALNGLSGNDITVTAHFSASVNGVVQPNEVTMVIAFDNYSVKYESPDRKLHVNKPNITISYTYDGSQTETADVKLNVQPIRVDVSKAKAAFSGDKVMIYDGSPRNLIIQSGDMPDATQVSGVKYTYFKANGEEIDEDKVIEVGTYSVTATFIIRDNNPDYVAEELYAQLTVQSGAAVLSVEWDKLAFDYNGSVQAPTPTFKDADGNIVTVPYHLEGVDNAISASSYTATLVIDDDSYTIDSSDATVKYVINKAILDTPTIKPNTIIIYNGATQNLEQYLDGFIPSIMNIVSGGSGANAGNYTAIIELPDMLNCSWKDTASNSVTVRWTIDRKHLTAVWDNDEFVANGSVFEPSISSLVGIEAIDAVAVDYDNDFIYSGDRNKSDIGAYTISVALNDAEWAANYILDGNTSWDYVIVPRAGMTILVIDWIVPEGGFVYNKNVQAPTFRVFDKYNNDITDTVAQLITVGGDVAISKWAGEYTATASIDGNYFIKTGAECHYTIVVDENGEGEDPEKNNGDKGDDFITKVKDFFDKLIASGFPLWQVATMAVAGLLTLIFFIKTVQYSKRKKKAKGEVKKLNAKTFAAIAPIFSTEVVYAGLTNKIWSIIAFSAAALALVMFAVALIARSAWKKAELAKEAAQEEYEQRKYNSQNANQLALQERISQIGQSGSSADMSIIEEMRREMEAQRREDEDRHRQEMEAMKIMLANMMGRSQADNGDMPIYGSVEDTDLLVQKVIAGLLPAVQQMMPEATAYLAAPSEENEELKALVEEQKALVEEQSEQIRNMSEQMASLQEQLTAMNEDRVEGVLLPDQSEEMKEISEQIAGLQEQLIAMTEDRVEGVLLPDESEEMKALTDKIAELQEQLITMSQQRVVVPNNQSEEIKALTDKIAELQAQIANPAETIVTANNSEEIKALTAQIAELQEQIANPADSSEEMKAMSTKMDAIQQQLLLIAQGSTTTVYVEKETEDDDVDDEEEWDSILDEDDDDFVEAVVIEEDGTVKKTSPNFRMRLKQSSDKNREWYTVIKNMFCSQKGVTYRVYKRVEKIRYQGQVVAVIGIAKRSIKLWLALKPYEYDARRYHHKDVSDKPRFVDVPMYVRVGSDRALTRAQELILALFQELNMEARKRYNDRSIQELIFTLKHNRLLTNKQNKQLLCEVMHVHDCDVLDDETAEKCIEAKNVDFIDNSVIETVKLDDIDTAFQDGNRVTLEKLKKVRLVSEECTGYNVVADKRLTKPLIIVANDFNLTAVKLIALTGGRAIKLQQV